MFLSAGNTLLTLFGGLCLLDALHAILDQRTDVFGLGGDKGGQSVGQDGGGGKHDSGEPVGDRGIGVAETEDDGELGAYDEGVTDGVSPEDGFEHFRSGGEDDGDKEDGEDGGEHKDLRTPHGGCVRMRFFGAIEHGE